MSLSLTKRNGSTNNKNSSVYWICWSYLHSPSPLTCTIKSKIPKLKMYPGSFSAKGLAIEGNKCGEKNRHICFSFKLNYINIEDIRNKSALRFCGIATLHFIYVTQNTSHSYIKFTTFKFIIRSFRGKWKYEKKLQLGYVLHFRIHVAEINHSFLWLALTCYHGAG